MLIAAAVLTSILGLVASIEAANRRNGVITLVITSIFTALLFCAGAILPPATVLGLLFAGLCWRKQVTNSDFPRFLLSSLIATGVVFGVCALPAIPEQLTYGKIREKYPYESLEARLPEPREKGASHPNLEAQISEFEWSLDAFSFYSTPRRTDALQAVHERTLGLFINSPGFGIARLLSPSLDSIEDWSRAGILIPQPGPLPSRLWSPGEALKFPAQMEPWQNLHRFSSVDFSHIYGFGFFKDRRHVAGFESHRFGTMPKSPEQWALQRVELVSLLLQETPRVYVSDSLPRMDKLKEVATRPLDAFEEAGLLRLRQGEELFLTTKESELYLLGAIRNVKQCLACHGGERGDLLGAFSYTFKKDGRQ